ncbi:DUF2470 domain-containing protein [Streptomyces pluripotens]|uniref:DUF2470 domain-containing protein n=1 Tax=Streptomyces pluripotens TaxID=1355015 RepID=A0A221NSZ2_9ACTN|nr:MULTISPECIES: DUF2470 domain-containing protein [Streptomyces]ARP68798.1 DUF2470 domain-containing protein [Streptomyces pluripotens]ASN23054.1 DUF2470 domain-containing protein [Streptomyces pluripotens]KIE27807.1 hypothetical protein LK08_06035 [Streptomyces sp. MUSC 125]MCH0558465.1 DUF2470 domain-containing protein [Streptomyces sp. MUM 16J]
MGDTQDWTAVPGVAERARSVLAAAWSCVVTADGVREEHVGAHTMTAEGAVRLAVPDDSSLFAVALCAPRQEPSAVLEFADVAPVPVCNRIRARLRLAGRLVPAGRAVLFRPARVVLRQSSGAELVDLDEFAAARPDPLTDVEPRLLTHLADAHPDAVEWLTRLVRPESLHAATRVVPLAVDRHGLTLRIERTRAHGDVRLPFHAPADDIAQLTERMHVLLGQANAATCPSALQWQRADGDG